MKPTWKEWIALVIVTPPMLCVMLWVLGGAIESRTDYVTKRDRCLAAATNSLDAERCR